MKLSFTKMQGCANDYIYLDCRASGVPADIAALAQRLSARHFSVGADGIICICAPVTPGADGRMRIFNADGSEAQMCGNGVRCVAEWLYTHGGGKACPDHRHQQRCQDASADRAHSCGRWRWALTAPCRPTCPPCTWAKARWWISRSP